MVMATIAIATTKINEHLMLSRKKKKSKDRKDKDDIISIFVLKENETVEFHPFLFIQIGKERAREKRKR